MHDGTIEMPATGTVTGPAGDYVLAPGLIRVWFADLTALSAHKAAMRALLSNDEVERADRFMMERLTDRFILRRGLLRLLLGRCTGRDPAGLVFDYGTHGKPALPGGPAFNLSDSEDSLAIAVAAEGRIGVDIERLRPIESADGIADRFFHIAERAALQGLAPERRDEGFLLAWTRKEAFIKAAGVGLSMPLDQFAVEVRPDAPPALLEIGEDLRGDVGVPADWSLFDRRVLPGTIAAIAAHGTGWIVEGRVMDAGFVG
ncbi:4'-phosphopantetheinyl transferase [Azospirillum lipoferum]|uniref:4'-phosphopantetheinyl transferase superfamily protein n=1 Tax=Azospirillum lipoferum TaxID=193 RepID=A0A5A9GQ35_AZOLI|nr:MULTISPECIES: 4'-phosphopantetheinyl transferase superfamily protein [Azospirillum]KAA0596528.1 4'-phosphopantetheinyl transferase superfamily protein [Azospirillum lipoferum]MCP1610529.1 4'-phosphopantetheinyl transferase [Azospirillum lipoferum]MDW5538028.1 4'-phosphopantetheinyl transferase superfamily protein [Azospirillum sp. NL1]